MDSDDPDIDTWPDSVKLAGGAAGWNISGSERRPWLGV
jgi:hypothetical protein